MQQCVQGACVLHLKYLTFFPSEVFYSTVLYNLYEVLKYEKLKNKHICLKILRNSLMASTKFRKVVTSDREERRPSRSHDCGAKNIWALFYSLNAVQVFGIIFFRYFCMRYCKIIENLIRQYLSS